VNSTARAGTPRHLRRLLVGAVAATTVAGLVGCTTDGDRPATVTLPEHGTTSSTTPPSLAPGGPGQEGTEGSGAGSQAPPELAWAVQVGGAGDDELLAVTGSQRSVVAVGSTSAGVETPTSGGVDVLRATVTSEGLLEAVTQFGDGGDDVARGVAASQDAVLACGSTTSALGAEAGGAVDAWCAPLGADGAELVTQLGGSSNEQFSGVSLPDDAVAAAPVGVTGYASGAVDGFFPGAQDPAGRGLGAGDALAVRIGADGRPLWARQFGTAGADAATAVRTVGDDGIFVGWTDGDLEGRSKGQRDGWISRIDASGVQRWITQLGGAGNEEFLAVAASGEARRGTEQFVAVGSTDGDVDGTGPLANSGGEDALISSFGTDGATRWTTQLGSELDDTATAVATDGSTVYVAGTTTTSTAGTATTVPGDGSGPTTSVPGIGLGELDPSVGPGGGTDGFLAALDAETGEVRWLLRLGSEADDTITAMTVTEDGMLVLAGTTRGQIADTPPAGGLDGFLLAFPLPSAGGGAASSV